MSLKLGQASREAERGWSLRSVMREIEEEGANARCLVREEREEREGGHSCALKSSWRATLRAGSDKLPERPFLRWVERFTGRRGLN